ncbi:MAG: aminopeptidase P N-terminal domain-containing protein [Gemmatimonadales bacterium]
MSRLLKLLLPVLLVPTVAGAQITTGEYVARRDSLAARIGDGVVLAFGGATPTTDFGPFYQLPAFRYLTGYLYPNADLVMVVRGGRAASTLFVFRTAARRALYYGEEPDSTAIERELGLASRDAGDLTRVADSLAATGLPVYTLRDFEAADFAAADSLTRGGQFVRGLAARHAGLVVKDAHPIVAQLRARKTEAELALLRRAGEISAEGHTELMKRIESGMHEYDLQAIIEYTFRRGGAERPAYGSIVGSGPLSLQLHYMKDRRKMEPGDVVVIDAGAEYDGYAADVTRTLPVSGTFTEEQRSVYRIVREAQAAAERNSKPGLSMAAALDSSVRVRARGLAALGVIESADAMFDPPWAANCERAPQSCRQVQLFAIHGITHGIGLEVHDPMQAYQDGIFKEGDAFTIEPGLYISPKLLEILPDTPRNRAFAAKVRAAVTRYQNTGIRIEDSYLITAKGLERISLAPRDLEEVENLTRRRPVP